MVVLGYQESSLDPEYRYCTLAGGEGSSAQSIGHNRLCRHTERFGDGPHRPWLAVAFQGLVATQEQGIDLALRKKLGCGCHPVVQYCRGSPIATQTGTKYNSNRRVGCISDIHDAVDKSALDQPPGRPQRQQRGNRTQYQSAS